jgi:mannonate dehydratase
MTFRWFGADDPVRLEYIRQVPGVTGIVSALHDLPPGEPWPRERVAALRDRIEKAGMEFVVAESIPVHEDIKLGRPTRDRLIAAYCDSIQSLGAAGVPVLCYNFMPIFDWTRTTLDRPLDDGSTSLDYDDDALARIDLSRGTGDLPGWGAAYSADELRALLAAYAEVPATRLWDNLAYFLERVVPAAETARVKLAIHPDDPPWPIFGLPRIIVDHESLTRLVSVVDSPANGVTFCTGSLGANPDNDLPAMIRAVGPRVNFAHFRNVRVTGRRRFQESAHPSRFGSVDMLAALRALHDVGFRGPIRPDHGRRIWGEKGRPGYGLHDRALGAMYLQGLWEAIDDGSRAKDPA